MRKYCFMEIIIRLVLFIIFLILSSHDPFIRLIQPEEMWLYRYPHSPNYVPTVGIWILTITVPPLLYICERFNKKKKNEFNELILSLTLNLVLNGCLTSLIKIVIGRPRPDFISRCFNGDREGNLLKCTGDRIVVMDGRKSFPSGHASFAFSSMVFLSLYLARKLKLFNAEGAKKEGWRLCACFMPLILASLIAMSRTCDYHHHYEDVIAGTCLGTVLACASFYYYFPLQLQTQRMNSPGGSDGGLQEV